MVPAQLPVNKTYSVLVVTTGQTASERDSTAKNHRKTYTGERLVGIHGQLEKVQSVRQFRLALILWQRVSEYF